MAAFALLLALFLFGGLFGPVQYHPAPGTPPAVQPSSSESGSR